MQDFRTRLAKNSISLHALSDVKQHDDKRWRTTGGSIYCPSCLHDFVRRSFAHNEPFRCPICSLQLAFIVWSKTLDGKAWKAGLSPIC